MTSMPQRVSVSSATVARLVFEKIFPAMEGERTDAMVMSLICAAVLAMRPDTETERLQQIIMDTSAFLITQLQDEVPAGEMN